MSTEQAAPALEVADLNAFYGKSQVIFDLDLSVSRLGRRETPLELEPWSREQTGDGMIRVSGHGSRQELGQLRPAGRRIGIAPNERITCRPGFGSSSSSLLCWPFLATLAEDASLGSRPVLALFR